MKLAFKRASRNPFTLGWWINRLSGGDGFCHVELVFSDGISFSSTTLDPEGGDKGVRFKWINYSHPEEWVFVQLFPSYGGEQRIREKAESIVGKPYDTRGTLRFAIPLLKEHPDAYFCSEADLTALHADPLFPATVAYQTGPNVLWRVSSAEEARLTRQLEVA
jgi:hypothetical protein